LNTYTLTGQKGNWASEAKATIKTEYKEGGKLMKEDTKDEYLPTPMKEGNPAYLSIMGSLTKNLGNYEAAKVSVSITYPCDPNDINESYDKLKNWLDKRLIQEISELG
jgi:hypothetical protein